MHQSLVHNCCEEKASNTKQENLVQRHSKGQPASKDPVCNPSTNLFWDHENLYSSHCTNILIQHNFKKFCLFIWDAVQSDSSQQQLYCSFEDALLAYRREYLCLVLDQRQKWAVSMYELCSLHYSGAPASKHVLSYEH